MRWCTATATASNAIAQPQYVLLWAASQGANAVLLIACFGPSNRAYSEQHCAGMLKHSYVGLHLDSWSSGWWHLTALCTSMPRAHFYANAYENWREDTAAISAVAVSACTLQLLGLSRIGSDVVTRGHTFGDECTAAIGPKHVPGLSVTVPRWWPYACMHAVYASQQDCVIHGCPRDERQIHVSWQAAHAALNGKTGAVARCQWKGSYARTGAVITWKGRRGSDPARSVFFSTLLRDDRGRDARSHGAHLGHDTSVIGKAACAEMHIMQPIERALEEFSK
jgi:hypothetical protein